MNTVFSMYIFTGSVYVSTGGSVFFPVANIYASNDVTYNWISALTLCRMYNASLPRNVPAGTLKSILYTHSKHWKAKVRFWSGICTIQAQDCSLYEFDNIANVTIFFPHYNATLEDRFTFPICERGMSDFVHLKTVKFRVNVHALISQSPSCLPILLYCSSNRVIMRYKEIWLHH